MRQAVTLGPHRIELRDSPMLTPGAGQALIRVDRVGICGSDLHIFHGKHPRATFPRIQGHEASGEIVELGPDYTGTLQTGVRVTIDPLIPCGSCYACRQHRSNCCPRLVVIGAHIDGLLQEYAVVPDHTLHLANQRLPSAGNEHWTVA